MFEIGQSLSPREVEEVARQVVTRLERIDILFNNAGICSYGLAHELTEEAWDAMIDINLKGCWLVAKHVIPGMIERKNEDILRELMAQYRAIGVR